MSLLHTPVLTGSALSSCLNTGTSRFRWWPYQRKPGHGREVVLELLDYQWAHWGREQITAPAPPGNALQPLPRSCGDPAPSGWNTVPHEVTDSGTCQSRRDFGDVE